jgi:hypothetical protein
MREKWKAGKKEYLKIHIVVNIKTKKILSIKVTDEHVYDSKVLPELVDEIIDSDNITTIGNYLLMMAPMKAMRFLEIWQ